MNVPEIETGPGGVTFRKRNELRVAPDIAPRR
jgi:hypothetical protein